MEQKLSNWSKKREHFHVYMIMLPQEAETITGIEMVDRLILYFVIQKQLQKK